jgi:hypothetical protein
MTKSDITGLWYEEADCVFFRNYVQSAHYISWGAKLLDVFTDSECKLVFVFSKEDHNRVKKRWNERKYNEDKVVVGVQNE